MVYRQAPNFLEFNGFLDDCKVVSSRYLLAGPAPRGSCVCG
jgi:hypothetical protein